MAGLALALALAAITAGACVPTVTASATNAFTSTVVLQPAAEHRIAVDTPVRRYVPDLIPAAYGTVTVRELLDHTGRSGPRAE